MNKGTITAVVIGVMVALGGFVIVQQDNTPAQETTNQQAATSQNKTAVEQAIERQSLDGVTIMDVRTDAEWNESHVEGALLFGLAERLEQGELPDLPKDTEIYIYCRSGNRAGQAITILVAQTVLFAVLLFVPAGSSIAIPDWIRVISLALSLLGAVILLRALFDLRHSLAVQPTPLADGKLQTCGMYALIRHPMYVAVWLIFGGIVLRSGSLLKAALFALLVVFFVFKARYEERLLQQKYQGYKDYMKRVGAFLPKFSKYS
jgi:protein-S-isoprenylcysteine O-methyltransferase Ste14